MPPNEIRAGNDLKNWQDPRDEDGNGIGDGAERLPQVKYDTVREAFRSEDGFWEGAGEVIRNTAAGRNTVGRVVGIGLDITGLFVPPVESARKKAKRILNLNQTNDMKDALKGILSKEAWKNILVFKDSDGNLDFQETLTTLVQMAAIIGALYLADYLGVLESFIAVTKLVFGTV